LSPIFHENHENFGGSLGLIIEVRRGASWWFAGSYVGGSLGFMNVIYLRLYEAGKTEAIAAWNSAAHVEEPTKRLTKLSH
jgi:hypothetical protein